MKILLVLLLGVAVAIAGENSCTPLYDENLETLPCVIVVDGSDINLEDDGADNCTTLSAQYNVSCCIVNGKCVVRDSGIVVSTEDTSAFEIELLNKAKNQTTQAQLEDKNDPATAGKRSLLTIPGIPTTCLPPPSFPAICKPTRHEQFVLDPPVDIPYCVRIPCKAIGNEPYDKDLKKCGSQAGCYFDKALSEYREAFGPSVLPGVPVCHLAIRNKFFQQRSLAISLKYGSWNPYFTNCLLQTFDKEIRKGPKGCELLPILDAFYVIPKMAGWININSYECALIDGCWRPSSGCFYPVDISKVRVKSGQRPIIFNKKEIVFGRPRCQVFDSSSPLNILKSYHRCLSSGCTVDSSVTSLYYNHLFTIGKGLTSKNHWRYWADVERGHVAAHNIESTLPEYGNYSPVPKKPIGCVSHPTPPIGTPLPGNSGGIVFPLPPQVDNSNCGHHFRQNGGRPCEPPCFQIKPNTYCPYKPFHVPRFPRLKGRFDGCCKINLCYLPKSEISRMHSGPSLYYTEWSLFTECSATCGRGQKRRYRKCISDDKVLCTQPLLDVKPCQSVPCSSWTRWSSFPPCPKTCTPGGVQTRKRKCFPKGGFCPGSAEDTRDCNRNRPCVTDSPRPTANGYPTPCESCTCTPWTAFSSCSQTCRPGGVQSRTRQCLSSVCSCETIDTRDCNRYKQCTSNPWWLPDGR